MTSLQILFRFPCVFGVRHQYAVRCTDRPRQVELRSVSEAGSKTGSLCGAEGAETFVHQQGRSSRCLFFLMHSRAYFPYF